jgi:hypothetical protein
MNRNKPAEAFVERPLEDVSQKTTRLSLRLTPEGIIDWSSASEKVKERFAQAVSNDPDALEMIGLAAGGGEGEGVAPVNPLEIQPEHVKMAIDMYATAEQFLIPKLIAAKSKGQVKISPEIAAACFTFSDDTKEKMAGPGAKWANESFPEWLKKFIFEMGPGAQFFGLLALCTVSQTKAALKATIESTHPPTAGDATAQAAPPYGRVQ